MPKKKAAHILMIVESPTKAKTISKFVGKDITVLSSFGHVRDLPKSKLGVDTEHNFEPHYIVPVKAKKVVSELKAAAKKATDIYFASDEDREGEAISWHLANVLGVAPEDAKRITFHEITEHAIKAALEHPRSLNQHMVDAQQARRVLDRLVGYELSPFLWRKIARGLSAGRVQSVVVRLIVEREREILAFIPKEYWSVEADLEKPGTTPNFLAKLTKKNGESLDKFAIVDGGSAEAVVKAIADAKWTVSSVERKTTHRAPSPPFTTSTLQQEANNRLGYSSKQTMMLAQQLYEGIDLAGEGHTGLITYMRTDSVNLADKFLGEAREWLIAKHGEKSVAAEHRKYKTKSKNAQEAHEAIRPTDPARTPESLAAHLDPKQLKVYELIWSRALASQMIDAELSTLSIDIDVPGNDNAAYTFHTTGSTIVAPGFMAVYETDAKETILPDLAEGDIVEAKEVLPKQHFTEPPPRYTEASLVKVLEENGIGRPSTYAPTIGTVVERGYVEKDARKLVPTELATKVNDLLVEHFPQIVDYQFTAKMEEDLDDVESGLKQWVPLIKDFYGPFHQNLELKDKEIIKTDEVTDVICDKCGKPMVAKFGRFGKFLACSGYPECKSTKQLAKDGSVAPEFKTDEKCPTCGADMVVKRSRFGEFLSCSRYPECKTNKPIVKKTGVKCNVCGLGEFVERKSRFGKMFYSCERYPDCKNALWSKPTGENCELCKHPIVLAKNDTTRCSNKECPNSKVSTDTEDAT